VSVILLPTLSTKIQVSDDTRAQLNRYASVMKKRAGRRVTFDEVIRELLEVARSHPPVESQ
jgi:hypothetical protein